VPIRQPPLWLGIAAADFNDRVELAARVQSIKKNRRQFLPGGSRLDRDQKKNSLSAGRAGSATKSLPSRPHTKSYLDTICHSVRPLFQCPPEAAAKQRVQLGKMKETNWAALLPSGWLQYDCLFGRYRLIGSLG
jgi:hypothetical protein